MTKPIRTIKDPAQPGDNVTVEQAREAARKVRERREDSRKDHIISADDKPLTHWKGDFTDIEMFVCKDGIKIFAGGATAKESRGMLIEWESLEKMKIDMKEVMRLKEVG